MDKIYSGGIGRVFEHLKNEKQGITSYQAYDKYGVTRLSSIIHRLRGDGFNIKSVKENGVNRYGELVNFVRYVLVR